MQPEPRYKGSNPLDETNHDTGSSYSGREGVTGDSSGADELPLLLRSKSSLSRMTRDTKAQLDACNQQIKQKVLSLLDAQCEYDIIAAVESLNDDVLSHNASLLGDQITTELILSQKALEQEMGAENDYTLEGKALLQQAFDKKKQFLTQQFTQTVAAWIYEASENTDELRFNERLQRNTYDELAGLRQQREELETIYRMHTTNMMQINRDIEALQGEPHPEVEDKTAHAVSTDPETQDDSVDVLIEDIVKEGSKGISSW